MNGDLESTEEGKHLRRSSRRNSHGFYCQQEESDSAPLKRVRSTSSRTRSVGEDSSADIFQVDGPVTRRRSQKKSVSENDSPLTKAELFDGMENGESTTPVDISTASPQNSHKPPPLKKTRLSVDVPAVIHRPRGRPRKNKSDTLLLQQQRERFARSVASPPRRSKREKRLMYGNLSTRSIEQQMYKPPAIGDSDCSDSMDPYEKILSPHHRGGLKPPPSVDASTGSPVQMLTRRQRRLLGTGLDQPDKESTPRQSFGSAQLNGGESENPFGGISSVRRGWRAQRLDSDITQDGVANDNGEGDGKGARNEEGLSLDNEDKDAADKDHNQAEMSDSGSEGEEEEGEEEEEEEEEEAGRSYNFRKRRPVAYHDKYLLRYVPTNGSPHHKRQSSTHRPFSAPVHHRSPAYNRQSRFTKHRRHTTHRSSSSTPSSGEDSDEKHFQRRKTRSMNKARRRCLPMNIAENDMNLAAFGAAKDRQRVGSSLADVDPMAIDSKVTFASIGGLRDHVKSLKEVVVFPLLYPEVFQRFSITPPRGVLFHGAPGCGKTLVARALANECSKGDRKVSFFMRKGADCLSKWVGESERQLRLLFDQAYQMRPSIIFFDEIDGLAPVRSSKQDQIHSSIVSTLLALMDGLDSRGEIVVIGATNRIDAIDPAFRRPGRFDRELFFPLPVLQDRVNILEIHTSKWKPRLKRSFLAELAELTVGYCGADLKALCAESALAALRRIYPQIYASSEKLVIDAQKILVHPRDFLQAMEKITPASQRVEMSPSCPLSPSIHCLLRRQMGDLIKALEFVFPAAWKQLQKAATLYSFDSGSSSSVGTPSQLDSSSASDRTAGGRDRDRAATIDVADCSSPPGQQQQVGAGRLASESGRNRDSGIHCSTVNATRSHIAPGETSSVRMNRFSSSGSSAHASGRPTATAHRLSASPFSVETILSVSPDMHERVATTPEVQGSQLGAHHSASGGVVPSRFSEQGSSSGGIGGGRGPVTHYGQAHRQANLFQQTKKSSSSSAGADASSLSGPRMFVQPSLKASQANCYGVFYQFLSSSTHSTGNAYFESDDTAGLAHLDNLDIYESEESGSKEGTDSGGQQMQTSPCLGTGFRHLLLKKTLTRQGADPHHSPNIFRTRLLICGKPRMGQTQNLGPALLHALEGFSQHVLDLPALYSVPMRSAEEACHQVLREARRTAPSVVYLPNMEAWWDTTGDTLKAIFSSALNSASGSKPLLVLATYEGPLEDLMDSIPDIFDPHHGEVVVVTPPTERERREYFQDVVLVQVSLPAVDPPVPVKDVVLEALPKAVPPPPPELSEVERKKLIRQREATLRELRVFLRDSTNKLLAERKFKEFAKPVDPDEVLDYYDVVTLPMDLSTVMKKIDERCYRAAGEWLKDIDLITSNALEYNPESNNESRLLRHRACELQDMAHSVMEHQLSEDFDKLCHDLKESAKRIGLRSPVFSHQHLPRPSQSRGRRRNNSGVSSSHDKHHASMSGRDEDYFSEDDDGMSLFRRRSLRQQGVEPQVEGIPNYGPRRSARMSRIGDDDDGDDDDEEEEDDVVGDDDGGDQQQVEERGRGRHREVRRSIDFATVTASDGKLGTDNEMEVVSVGEEEEGEGRVEVDARKHRSFQEDKKNDHETPNPSPQPWTLRLSPVDSSRNGCESVSSSSIEIVDILTDSPARNDGEKAADMDLPNGTAPEDQRMDDDDTHGAFHRALGVDSSTPPPPTTLLVKYPKSAIALLSNGNGNSESRDSNPGHQHLCGSTTGGRNGPSQAETAADEKANARFQSDNNSSHNDSRPSGRSRKEADRSGGSGPTTAAATSTPPPPLPLPPPLLAPVPSRRGVRSAVVDGRRQLVLLERLVARTEGRDVEALQKVRSMLEHLVFRHRMEADKGRLMDEMEMLMDTFFHQ